MSNLKLMDILGQDQAIAHLKSMLESDRLPSALLFSGPDGTGKRTTALAFARALACEKRIACGICAACRAGGFGEGHRVVDIAAIFETEKDKTAALRKELASHSMAHALKRFVVIVTEADRMNDSMQAAMLKSIEEPAPGVLYILVAASPQNLTATIRSRMLSLRFRALDNAVLERILRKESPSLFTGRPAPETAEWLRLSGGSLSRARGFLERRVPPADLAAEFLSFGRKRGLSRTEAASKLFEAIPALAAGNLSWREALLALDRAVNANGNIGLAFSVFTHRTAGMKKENFPGR